MKKAILTSLFGSVLAFSLSAVNAQDAKATPVTTNEILTISNSPQIKGAGITVKGQALYLRPSSDRAIVGYEVLSNGSRSVNGTTLRLKGNDTWGWNVGLNAQLGTSRKFELDANWFYLLADMSVADSVPVGGATRILPVFGYIPTTLESVSSLNSNMKAMFNLVDLNLHKRIDIGSAIEVDPFIGLAGGFIGMRLTETYLANSGSTYYGIYGSKYLAIGLNTGINAKWKVAAGFSFIGNFTCSILYGNYKVQSGLLTSSQTPYAGTYSDFHAERSNLNIDLGVNWDHYFKDNKWYISLLAGWKQRIFFNQLNLCGIDVVTPVNFDGNMGLQGLFFGGKVGF